MFDMLLAPIKPYIMYIKMALAGAALAAVAVLYWQYTVVKADNVLLVEKNAALTLANKIQGETIESLEGNQTDISISCQAQIKTAIEALDDEKTRNKDLSDLYSKASKKVNSCSNTLEIAMNTISTISGEEISDEEAVKIKSYLDGTTPASVARLRLGVQRVLRNNNSGVDDNTSAPAP